MGRDSSGNYTLPGAYNPVLTGTTITSTWANNTLSDIAAALTDSLSRSGKGGMNAVLLCTDGTAGAPGLAFASEQTTGLYRNGASTPTFVVNGVPVWNSNPTKQFVVTAVDNQASIIENLPTATNGFLQQWQHGGTEIGRIGTGVATMTGAALADFGISALSGVLRLGTAGATYLSIAQNGVITLSSSTAGGVVVNAPTGTNFALTVNGAANQYAQKILANSAANQSFGLLVQAGTSSSDSVMTLETQAGTTILWETIGNGQSFVYVPNAATSSPANMAQVGYVDAPQNAQSANYQLILSDRGQSIVFTGGTTCTIPANASVAFPIGTMILIVNRQGGSMSLAITTDSLILAGSGTSGTRTLASNAVCSLLKTGATVWLAGGPGVT